MSDTFGPFGSPVSPKHPSYKKAYNKFKKNSLIKMYYGTEKATKGKSELVKEDNQELTLKVMEAFEMLRGQSRHLSVVKEFIKTIQDSKKYTDEQIKEEIINYLKRKAHPYSPEHLKNINNLADKLVPYGIEGTQKNIEQMKAKSHKLPEKSLKINEALQLVKFRYSASKHDPVPEVKVLDTEYKGQPSQSTYGQRRDILGWNLNYYENKEEAKKTIDEIDDFARILGADKKEKYERIKQFFPEQASLLRRYIKDNCKGLKVRDEGLWKPTNWDSIKDLTD